MDTVDEPSSASSPSGPGLGFLAIPWILRQLWDRRNRRQTVVFILYVATMIGFAFWYHALYLSTQTTSPNPHFAFNSDILRARNTEIERSLDQRLTTQKLQHQIVSDLRTQLGRQNAPPRPRSNRMSSEDIVIVQVGDYVCEFDLSPYWSLGPGRRLLKRNLFIIEDRTGHRLLNREVMITGPEDHTPRPKKLQQWMNEIARGLRLDMYQQMTATVLADLSAEIKRLEAEMKETKVETQRYWSYWDFLYFSVITQATVGYGDILPNSTTVRIIVMLQVLVGLVLVVFAINFVLQR